MKPAVLDRSEGLGGTECRLLMNKPPGRRGCPIDIGRLFIPTEVEEPELGYLMGPPGDGS